MKKELKIIKPEQRRHLLSSVIDDVSEIEYKGLIVALDNSTYVWGGYVDDIPVGYWGIIPASLIDDGVYLWLQPTKNFKKFGFIFARETKYGIKEILTRYSKITGHCQKSNPVIFRWLSWLGATFFDTKGDYGYFEIKR